MLIALWVAVSVSKIQTLYLAAAAEVHSVPAMTVVKARVVAEVAVTNSSIKLKNRLPEGSLFLFAERANN